jgi:deglycase
MAAKLQGETVAILAADGVEETELMRPWAQLYRAGARPVVVSMARGAVRAQQGGRAAHVIAVDADVRTTPAERYDGLVIPGGAGHADRLRADAEIVRFIEAFFRERKPVAAFSEGVAMALEVEQMEGRATAGGKLIIARRPDSLDAFTQRVINELLQRRHGKRRRAAMAALKSWLPQRRGGSSTH